MAAPGRSLPSPTASCLIYGHSYLDRHLPAAAISYTLPFYGRNIGLVIAAYPVENLRILLEQSFTGHIPCQLYRIQVMEKTRRSNSKLFYLHRLCTVTDYCGQHFTLAYDILAVIQLSYTGRAKK